MFPLNIMLRVYFEVILRYLIVYGYRMLHHRAATSFTFLVKEPPMRDGPCPLSGLEDSLAFTFLSNPRFRKRSSAVGLRLSAPRGLAWVIPWGGQCALS